MRPVATILLVLCLVVLIPSPVQHAIAAPTIPSQTDDGLDPVNLIFIGYAPAWWVVQNFQGWNPTPCSEPKTLAGRTYDFTMETPNTEGQLPPCFGPRYHARVWDMGVDSVFGRWSIGAVHHEHTVCNPVCHHVIDGWENAEALVRSTFANSGATVSISNHTLPNSGIFQGFPNDGNAALIQLSTPSTYPVSFMETGLRPGTQWSVTMNETTLSTTSDNIVFSEPNGTYTFAISSTAGYNNAPATGTLKVTGDLVKQPVGFTPFEYFVSFYESGLPTGTSWSVTLDGKSQQSTERTITFQVPGGSHLFEIQSQSGYTSTPSSGSLVVSKDATVNISYDATLTLHSILSRPGVAFFFSVTLAAWMMVVAAAILTIWRRKKSASR